MTNSDGSVAPPPGADEAPAGVGGPLGSIGRRARPPRPGHPGSGRCAVHRPVGILKATEAWTWTSAFAGHSSAEAVVGQAWRFPSASFPGLLRRMVCEGSAHGPRGRQAGRGKGAPRPRTGGESRTDGAWAEARKYCGGPQAPNREGCGRRGAGSAGRLRVLGGSPFVAQTLGGRPRCPRVAAGGWEASRQIGGFSVPIVREAEVQCLG